MEASITRLPQRQSRFEITRLEDRIAPAVVIGGGLIGVNVAISNVRVPIDVDVQNNTICVNVAAIDSQAHC